MVHGGRGFGRNNNNPKGYNQYTGKGPHSEFSSAIQGRMEQGVEAKGKRFHEGRPDGTGTEDDPIDCNGDLDHASVLLAQGKHIRLNSPIEVSMLIDRLGSLARRMEEKGEKAPTFDLCKITVPKTNLFCQQSKGIPRAKMPQLSGPPVPGSPASKLPLDVRGEADGADQFEAALAKAGFKIEHTTVPSETLKATQSQLNGAKVAGIMGAIRHGTFAEKELFVTRDNYILDGHHRWAAKVGMDSEDGVLGNQYPTRVKRINMEIGQALDFANDFAKGFGFAQAGVSTFVPQHNPVN